MRLQDIHGRPGSHHHRYKKNWVYKMGYNRNYRFKLKYDYASWIDQILKGQYDDQQWTAYIITFMYNHIPGTIEHRFSVMENEIDRMYGTLVRHVLHGSRSPAQRKKLPRLHAFPDDAPDVTINNGLH